MPKKPAPAPTMTLTKALWAFVGVSSAMNQVVVW
jgi:hypothetical protein